MSVVSLTATAAKYNAITKKALVAGHTDGVTYPLTGADENLILVVYNSSADTAYDLTVKKPANQIWTSAGADIVLEIPFGEVAILPLESAKFYDPTAGVITLDVENAALKFALFQVS